MIVVLFFLCGLAAGGVGLMVVGMWVGASLVLGLIPPTEEQGVGVVLLMACAGALGSIAIAGALFLWDCRARKADKP